MLEKLFFSKYKIFLKFFSLKDPVLLALSLILKQKTVMSQAVRFMAAGPIGVHGEVAQKLVGLDQRYLQGYVITQHLNMEDRIV